MRSQSQRALARDVEGFRNRFGNLRGRAGASIYGSGARSDREEGLDERGEAPPPYVPGSKPPSVRNGDGVELGDMSRESMHQPPGYNEHMEEGDLSVRRPDAVVTAVERSRSTRPPD